MNEPVTIRKELPGESPLNYEFLREEGVKLIQQLAGTTWTDHNIHDPGITILEQLCYAMTDIAYRADFDIKELLAKTDGDPFGELFSPASIFTVNPVTLQDLRKVVIDVPGVKNAWVEKVDQRAQVSNTTSAKEAAIKGLYRVVLDPDEWVSTGTDINQEVKSRLHTVRGVCEDFESITTMAPQPIQLKGSIEISNRVEDINELVASVLHQAGTFLSPRVSFYSLSELLAKGKPIEDIFNGPALHHGFIDDEELHQKGQMKEVHASDVIREIMDVPGIKTIESFALATGTSTIKDWILPLDPSKSPRLDVRATLQSLIFTIQGIPATLNMERIKEQYHEMGREGLSSKLAEEERDVTTERSSPRNIDSYYSIQNQFPANYGIGSYSLPDKASAKRKAQAKQLKTYLTFFEQLLTNYMTQIAHFKELVSFDGDNMCTYHKQSLVPDVLGLDEVLVNIEEYEEHLSADASGTAANTVRKNKILNHLLARFGEDFSQYAILLKETSESNGDSSQNLINVKAKFLQNYPALSSGRSSAFNYTKVSWESDQLSGLEKRISGKLGIQESMRSALAGKEIEGFHLVEHILFRPRSNNSSTLQTYFTPGDISAFERLETKGHILCTSSAHGLQQGEFVFIEAFNQEHEVVATTTDTFEIVDDSNELPAKTTWKRTKPDMKICVLTNPVLSMSKPDKHTVRIEVIDHQLQINDEVEIIGSGIHDGRYTIIGTTENSYDITSDLEVSDEKGRWMPLRFSQDYYSLQLTYILPDWPLRFAEEQFRLLIENTIVQETPAHLTPYIKWVDRSEMALFEMAYQRFLTSLISTK